MKKRFAIFIALVLFSFAVHAAENIPYDSTYPPTTSNQITRYTDFPLDNIHILRLQDASESLNSHVENLQGDLKQYEQQRTLEQKQQEQKIAQLEEKITSFQITALAQLDTLQKELQDEAVEGIDDNSSFPFEVIFLVTANAALLVLAILLIFWLKKHYTHTRKHEEAEHIHPAPESLVKYVMQQLEDKQNVHEIRIELARRGWNPSIIEHAIRAAKERKD